MRQAMQLARNKGKEGNAAWVTSLTFRRWWIFVYGNFIGEATIGVSAYMILRRWSAGFYYCLDLKEVDPAVLNYAATKIQAGFRQEPGTQHLPRDLATGFMQQWKDLGKKLLMSS